ncbi:hypothetical protein AB6A40_010733 [Gnathostoma spinigerum]|uniref:Uncharacterized protein n=1 Tax=Gnathostoma spinigerum TaxID=75299 RepID=A0ABD6F0E2_9BILA
MNPTLFSTNEEFDESDVIHKEGPSSRGTVMTMAGLFIVGVMLCLSGLIVLFQQNETPFVIAGCVFLTSGVIMICACGLLQRKNIIKFLHDVNRDLYFLNMSDSYMWKIMFEEHRDLPTI